MAGYSGKPLHAKLGLKAGQTVVFLADNNVETYKRMLGSDLPEISIITKLQAGANVIHVFTASRAHLANFLPQAMATMARDGMIWVSWPKKASKVPSDVTEDIVRAVALPLGLVDVKVCAVDQIYSGLKLVIRKALR